MIDPRRVGERIGEPQAARRIEREVVRAKSVAPELFGDDREAAVIVILVIIVVVPVGLVADDPPAAYLAGVQPAGCP